MPTPRPISDAEQRGEVGDVGGVAEQRDRRTGRCRRRRCATAIGSSIAKSEPKARKRTTAAASDADHLGEPGGRLLDALRSPGRPARPAVRRVRRPARCRRRPATSSLGTAFACSAKVIWAYAIRPSSLICAAPAGCVRAGDLADALHAARSRPARAGSGTVRTASRDRALVDLPHHRVGVARAAAGRPSPSGRTHAWSPCSGGRTRSRSPCPRSVAAKPRPNSAPTHSNRTTSRCR